MNKTINYILSLAFITLFLNACKEETIDPGKTPDNATELITTLKVILTDSATSAKTEFIFRDKDGEGGNAPERFDTIKVSAGKVYSCELQFLDESKAETDTISNEIIEEANEHLIYFDPKNVNMNIQITDKDGNNLPLGLFSKWRNLSSGNGFLEIVLKHQPGVKDGSRDKGETDASVSFRIEIL